MSKVDPKDLDWDRAGEAVSKMKRIIDSIGFVAPEATDVLQVKVQQIAREMNEVARALKLGHNPDPQAG